MDKNRNSEPLATPELALHILNEAKRITANVAIIPGLTPEPNEPARPNSAPQQTYLHHSKDGDSGLIINYPYGSYQDDDPSIMEASINRFSPNGPREVFRIILSFSGLEVVNTTFSPRPIQSPAIKTERLGDGTYISILQNRRSPDIKTATKKQATSLLSWLKQLEPPAPND